MKRVYYESLKIGKRRDMEKRVTGIEIITIVKDEWVNDFRRFLIPSLELMVIALMMVLPIILIAIPLSYIPFIMIYFIAEQQMVILIPLMILFSILFYVFIILFSIVVNGVIIGGTTVVSKRVWERGEYQFFDILKTGWKHRKKFIPLAGATILTQILIGNIVSLCIMIVIAPFFFLAMIHPALIVIPMMLFFLAYIPLIVFNLFFMTFPYVTFTYYYRNKTRPWDSVKGGLRFMMRNKGMCLLFGGFIYIIQMISSILPGLALFTSPASIVFIHQCLHIAMEDEGN